MNIHILEQTFKKPKDVDLDITSEEDFSSVLSLHDGTTIAEKKYDGLGIIIDKRKDLSLYSLQKNLWSADAIPELKYDLCALPNGLYVGEIVGKPTRKNFSNKDEFLAVQKRNLVKPNHATKRLAEEHPLEIRIYDALQIEDQSLVGAPTSFVKQILAETLQTGNILPTAHTYLSHPQELQQYTLY